MERVSDHSDAGRWGQDEEVREIVDMIVETAVLALMDSSKLDRETVVRLIRIAAENCR